MRTEASSGGTWSPAPPPFQGRICPSYLNCKGAQDDGAEDGVAKDAVEDVALPVDLAGVDLVEQLHHHEGVEDDGVVLRGRGMQGRVPPTVDVKEELPCKPRGM